MNKILEKILIIGILTCLGLLSVWLQFGIIEEQPVSFDSGERHDPDYYIENFTAVGMDEQGQRRYVLEAERMVHYPDDDTALLDNPHVVEYDQQNAPRHTYAESGWVSSDGNEILLTGNVRVIQGQGQQGPGGVMTTDKMRILLDRGEREK
jgi:lipopolysaccharide export system protein LptC